MVRVNARTIVAGVAYVMSIWDYAHKHFIANSVGGLIDHIHGHMPIPISLSGSGPLPAIFAGKVWFLHLCKKPTISVLNEWLHIVTVPPLGALRN